MSQRSPANYLYMNREGLWLDFQLKGLESDRRGALRLVSLPRPAAGADFNLADLPKPDGPGGMAFAQDGALFFSDTQGHRIRVRDCDDSWKNLPCANGPGEQPSQLSFPRGLLCHKGRGALVVADSGNHRLQLFDLRSWQLIGVWGGHGDAPGLFDSPVALASDSRGDVYVADSGNGRIQKFDSNGQVIASFWETAKQDAALNLPVAVAVDSQDLVWALDSAPPRLLVFDVEGQLLKTEDLLESLNPMGLWVGRDGAVYLGDNAGCRLLRLDEGAVSGEAPGYEGPVAALAVDRQGGLWVHPGGSEIPLRFDVNGAFVKSGILWGGPFSAGGRPASWHRLQARGLTIHPGVRLSLVFGVSDQPDPPPDPSGPSDPQPFDLQSGWNALPPGLPDALLGVRSQYLWIGAHFESEGKESPRLEQIRVDYDHTTYTKHLPAVYLKQNARPQRLERFLSLFESFFVDAERQIGDLDRFFDALATPPDWLDWLAGWLGLELDEEWSEEKKRQAIQEAFAAYAWRGTAVGLRRALRFETGVEATVEEPLAQASWWRLPDAESDCEARNRASRLGFTTRLASSEPQGSVLGTSAVLDRSKLIAQEEFGSPLFQDLAHRFGVYVHRSQVADPDLLERVRNVIEREKPAFADYRLCIVEPRLRVGLQSRLGVDTVLGGGSPRPSRLGHKDPSPGTVLAGQRAGRIGLESRVGVTTRLGGLAAADARQEIVMKSGGVPLSAKEE